MSLVGRSVISIDDLSDSDFEDIFETADAILERGFLASKKLAQGLVLSTLFFEPSTRTRLSFESAISRLGGHAISAWDMAATSLAKGESLVDTIRVVSKYADVIALRHPWDGSAQLAADHSDVPVINAGDGGHEHPTQTLCDLFTLRRRHGELGRLKVALCGDLEHGRTIHSLAFALARLRATVIFVPGNGKEVPDYVLGRLQRDYGAKIQSVGMGVLSALFGKSPEDAAENEIDAIYMTPTEPNQLALMTQEGTRLEETETQIQLTITAREPFAFYVTRLQKERSEDEGGRAEDDAGLEYPKITQDMLKIPQFKNISILHPLPRVDEISPEVDTDSRSAYFEQAGYGVPIRMALLIKILDLPALEDSRRIDTVKYVRPIRVGNTVKPRVGLSCPNRNCVTRRDSRAAERRFELIKHPQATLRCLYCDFETRPKFFGLASSSAYYPAQMITAIQGVNEDLVFFSSTSAAHEAGYVKSADRPKARKRKKVQAAQV